ncbi:uncharacterized protein LOC124996159 isoform X2 [Mugil cephalus]|uniref:uncharacterized protein LOC124996159 isoform X2 n=1 Tax=Mugil cephalus TaxID=48193 RepID=UPI001FB6290F|nr:uncharacterized protein LOC124996159 isoform X2 [Mugil cephalus]
MAMATDTNTLSKFRSIIPKCEVIQEGSPSCFKLTTKTEPVGTLRRVTFGRRNVDMPNKTILLVGETGAGKSTLVNFLVNYSMGVKFEDDVWFDILEGEEKKSQSESQTTDVIVYKIFGFEGQTLPYSLTIIDTPGYGSTEAIEHDVVVNQRLFDWFRSEDGVHEVDVVGVVMKATDNRLSDRLSYVFNSVMSLFGKDLEKNIVALMTHSDGLTPTDAVEALKVATIKCAKNNKGQLVHFVFNNRQHQDRSQQRQRKKLEEAHQISVEGMKGLVAFMEKTAARELKETADVLNERIRLTACIQNLNDRIHMTEMKQRELRQTKEALKKHEQEMKMNKQFTIEVDEAYKELEATDGRMWGLFFFEGAVCCTHCEENCHYPGCTVAWKPEHCEVMKKGRCTVCSRNCLASAHVKDKWVYVEKTRRVKKTLTDMKNRYESNKAEAAKKTSLLKKLQQEIENLEKDKEKWLEEAYQHVERLELIALHVDSVSTHVHLGFFIERMKIKGYTEKFQRLKEMAQQVNKHLQSGIQYAARMWSRLTRSDDEMRDTEV